MNFKGTLTQIKGESLRTDAMEGYFENLPKLGERFNIMGAPLEKLDGGFELGLRLISTNIIKEIISIVGKSIVFKTYSGSKYCLEYSENE